MSVEFLPPERDPQASELRSMFDTAHAMQAEAFRRLLDDLDEHPRYNGKVAEAKEIISRIPTSSTLAIALRAELQTIVGGFEDKFEDWVKRRSSLVLEVVGASDRFRALAERDRPHPNSLMGRPLRPQPSERDEGDGTPDQGQREPVWP